MEIFLPILNKNYIILLAVSLANCHFIPLGICVLEHISTNTNCIICYYLEPGY
jgi:hypothetical protein